MIEAAVDNDFVIHLAETQSINKDDLPEIIRTLFQEMDVRPFMHELVYRHEFSYNDEVSAKRIAKTLFDREIIAVRKLSEVLDNEDKKNYYEKVFFETYGSFKGQLPVRDIFTEWKRYVSMGEVHTITMCAVTGADIFLSDDNDARVVKRLIYNLFGKSIDVLNRDAACQRAAELGSGKLDRKTRRALSHD